MGCITQPQKPKKKFKKEDDVASVKRSRLVTEQQHDMSEPKLQIKPKPKHKKITAQQFCCRYRIQNNCDSVSKIEGPKHITNIVDGTNQILRVLPFEQFDQKRVKAYKELLEFELLEDDEGNLLLIDEYCCGEDLTQVALTQNQPDIISFLQQIYDCIEIFHARNIVLGNLNLFSFRYVSPSKKKVRLVDFNLLQSYEDSMGHAHKDGKQVDWQAFGFMVQYVVSKFPPIFLSHKIQYIQSEEKIVTELLRGKKIPRQALQNIKIEKPDKCIGYGYRLRLDINKLLKIRKRRTHHRICYYSEAVTERGRINEDSTHRLETSRILSRIDSYIQYIEANSEEPFLMFAEGTDKFKKLKEVFILKEKNKKMNELKELLPLIR